jgi:hypothetical protein
MSPKDFVIGLHTTIVDENIEIYKNLFQNTVLENVSDPYWRNALVLFNTLSEEQRDIFFSVIKQVIVDTTSNLLGVIDGVSSFTGQENEFLLLASDSHKSLSGDLQDLFLEEEEKRSR